MRRGDKHDQVDDGKLRAIRSRIGRELPHLSAQEVGDLAWAVERLVKSFRPDWIYVFGSHARGTPGPNSDIDLMVVVGDSDQPLHRLDQQGYGVLEPYRLPIELVFITRGDFERLPVPSVLE